MTGKINIEVAGGSDLVAFTAAIGLNFTGGSFKSKFITINGNGGDRLTMLGRFNYDSVTGELNGGRVTATRWSDNGVLYATAKGDSIDAEQFYAAFLDSATDPTEFFNLFGDITFNGNAGADVGFGLALADSLFGFAGDDQLLGFAGNDLINGGAGGDGMDGGVGNDTVSYDSSTSRVSVNLTKGSASGGDATGDVIAGFENITGSGFNDKLTGTASANILKGGVGKDTLTGEAGGDTLDGGQDNDTASYIHSKSGVDVNLESGAVSGGHSAGDTLISIESVLGSKFDDVLTGDNKANALKGSNGDDTLRGGANTDILKGGSGDDTLDGGQSIDHVSGDAGNDTIILNQLAGNMDFISNFVPGSDRLQIDASLFGGGLTGGVALAPGQLVLNGTGSALDADDRFILNTATGELFFDNNGSNAGDSGSRLIADFEGAIPVLTVADFDIV